MMNERVEVV